MSPEERRTLEALESAFRELIVPVRSGFDVDETRLRDVLAELSAFNEVWAGKQLVPKSLALWMLTAVTVLSDVVEHQGTRAAVGAERAMSELLPAISAVLI